MVNDNDAVVATYIDKNGWGAGPWQMEPDRVLWTDPATGLVCLLRRSNPDLGNWCGYVGVGAAHPAHGKSYDEVEVDVHGGLTYSAACDGDEQRGVCHVPSPGEPDSLWWLGFDCGHFSDLMPAMAARLGSLTDDARLLDALQGHDPFEVYRDDLAYVRGETLGLAEQLAAITGSVERLP